MREEYIYRKDNEGTIYLPEDEKKKENPIENTSEEYPRIKCIKCGYPVDFPSMGGRDLCAWCDDGQPRPDETK